MGKCWKITILLIIASNVGVTRAETVPVKVVKSKSLHPNIILITIDTVRADHLGCYGYKNINTPTLDSLAADGIVFEHAISQVPLTWPSHAAILTGTYPFQNGVQDFTGQPLAPQFRTVAEAFRNAGYATGAVVSAFVLDRSWGLARGFQYYDDAFSAETFQRKDIGLVDRRAELSVTHALSWMKIANRPFFFWLHLYDPHSPYDPPEPYRTEYRGHLYDGEIAYADHALRNVVAWLKQTRLYDSSVIVVLSDHGESLGEHGEDEHGFFVYNATVHVPLIVKPALKNGIRPGRSRQPVETTAVAPTLLKLAGLRDPIRNQFQTQPLFGEDGKARDPAYSETFYPFSSFGWSPLRALESERFHYIDAPKPELFDLENDPGETKNIFADQPATATVLKEKLRQIMIHNPFRPPDANAGGLSPDAQEKLRALGYIGFRAAMTPESLAAGLADPKDKLWEFNTILTATDAFKSKRYSSGEALLAQVAEKDPRMYLVSFLLGEAALDEQKWEVASRAFQKCLDLNPNFDQAMTGLARALIFQGKSEDAKRAVQNALRINPTNYRAWYQLGFIESKSDASAALADYEKALSIQENFAPLRRDLGLLYYEQQNYSEAAKHLSKAAELGVNDAHLYNVLGICYSRTHQLVEAVGAYKRALGLDPNLAEAHLNLAYAYQRLGRPKAAEAEYNSACQLDAKLCKFVPGS